MRIALAGNPNSGKTTLFNALTGSIEHVGNWPGVTVARKEGFVKKQLSTHQNIRIVDLPGTYSMSPFTNEERITKDYVQKEHPDVIINIIDAHRDQIIDFAKDIYTHAELGYKEFRTAEKFANFMKDLGLPTKEHLAVTGVKAYLNEEEKTNVSLALIGELDALRIPEHKYANPETQGAHCCGHHAQLAGVIGAALALTNEDVKKELDGQVVFFAVPAEE